jgi:dihydroorotase
MVAGQFRTWERQMANFDLIVRGGRVIDPGQGIDGVHDVAVKAGTIAQVAPRIAGTAARTVDARNQLVIPGMIDTHSHIYQHVTGDFGMNPDEVGIRSGVTTVVDQGGAAPLTIQGFRKFIKDPAATRVYAFVSNYLVGGLLGHRHVGLYGPHGINVRETINAIEKNRDFVKGIKCHAEVGGYSRWGIETLRLGKEASRAAKVPVYVHLGRLWAEENGTTIDPDRVIDDALPLLDPGDILAHPFTKHPGAFVSREGKVHPLIFEAMARGVRIDVGRGGHMSFNAARIALDAGVVPFTVGSDIHGYTIRRRDESSVWGAGAFGGELGQLTTIGGHRCLLTRAGDERAHRAGRRPDRRHQHGDGQRGEDARRDGRAGLARSGTCGGRVRPRDRRGRLDAPGQPGRAHQDRQASPARARATYRQGASLAVTAAEGGGSRGGVRHRLGVTSRAGSAPRWRPLRRGAGDARRAPRVRGAAAATPAIALDGADARRRRRRLATR